MAEHAERKPSIDHMLDWSRPSAAIHLDGSALQYASAELQADRELAVAAVSRYMYGKALQYASAELSGDGCGVSRMAGHWSGGRSAGRRRSRSRRAVCAKR